MRGCGVGGEVGLEASFISHLPLRSIDFAKGERRWGTSGRVRGHIKTAHGSRSPAEAGVQVHAVNWAPAYAGERVALGSHLRLFDNLSRADHGKVFRD